MPVMPGYVHADVPHEKTIQPAGYRYGCSSVRTGDTSPRGGQTRYIAHSWNANAGRLIVTDWLPRACGHDLRATDPACADCANRIQEQSNGTP